MARSESARETRVALGGCISPICILYSPESSRRQHLEVSYTVPPTLSLIQSVVLPILLPLHVGSLKTGYSRTGYSRTQSYWYLG